MLSNTTPSVTHRPHHNCTFIESLKLSDKNMHDFVHVAQTFFYLQVKPPTDDDKNENMSIDGISETKSGTSDPSVRFDANAVSVESVYNLELVSQDKVDKEFYFTISKEGITMYRNKVSEFTGLTQWEREYSLFNKIAKIRFFKLYRRWKAFIVWKTGLRGGKRALASGKLQTDLFLFNAPLRNALLTVSINLFAIFLANFVKFCLLSGTHCQYATSLDGNADSTAGRNI